MSHLCSRLPSASCSMASALVPSTPTSQTPPPLTATPTTGSWQHPKIAEIARRQSQATFTDRNLNWILWNGGALLSTWGLSWTTQQAYVFCNQSSLRGSDSPPAQAMDIYPPHLSFRLRVMVTSRPPPLFPRQHPHCAGPSLPTQGRTCRHSPHAHSAQTPRPRS